MGCDMCGNTGQLYICDVDSVEMQLCDNCKIYGKIKKRIPSAKELEQHEKQRQQREVVQEERRVRHMTHEHKETYEIVGAGYGQKIKNAREAQGLKQEQLAKRLAMKESQLHKYETEAKKPDISTARELERALRISIVEQYEEKHEAGGGAANGPVTIGDLLKKK